MVEEQTIAQAHIGYEVIVDVSSDILVCICLHLFTDCCCCIQGRIYFYQEISINYITHTIYGLWFAFCSSSTSPGGPDEIPEPIGLFPPKKHPLAYLQCRLWSEVNKSCQ